MIIFKLTLDNSSIVFLVQFIFQKNYLKKNQNFKT